MQSPRHWPEQDNRATWFAAVVTGIALALVHLQLYRVIENEWNAAYPQYVTRNFTAATVMFAVFALPLLLRRLHVGVTSWAWMAVGLVSALASMVPMALHATGSESTASFLYGGQRVPQAGAIFVDLLVPLKSLWCSRLGFDVFEVGNGCMDPVIYGPGFLWLKWIPFNLHEVVPLAILGVTLALACCCAAALLARMSGSLGVLALLVCVLGAPWLLLLERGNLDAIVLLTAVGLAVGLSRRNTYGMWLLAALAFWILGTWKYYPFAMGVGLLLALGVRRGWTIVVGYLLASLAFVALTWNSFLLSQQGNQPYVDDYIMLGRIPVVARMVDAVFPPSGWQMGDVFIFVLAISACAWGFVASRNLIVSSVRPIFLGSIGSALYLGSILVAGFGFAYKSVFLLLCVPLLSIPAAFRTRARIYSFTVSLVLVVIGSVVVWNTVLASLAGIIAGSFAFGSSLSIMLKRFLIAREDTRVKDGLGTAGVVAGQEL